MSVFFLFLFSCTRSEKVNLDPEIEENTDLDGDGFLAEEDCDDSDPTVNVNATEICDGLDNDCDGDVDEDVLITYYEDADNDGFGANDSTVEACNPPNGYVLTSNDCDDTDPEKYPGSTVLCDDLASSFCSSGGNVSGTTFQGVFCLSPLDIFSGGTYSGSAFVWKPGPITRISK